MAVTGDIWLSLTLGQMFPEIDPNNPGSAASLIRDKVNEVEGRFQQTLSAANDVIAASSSLLGQLDVVGSALTGAQNGIEELVDNAGNTGVYFRLLGVCPDFPNSLFRSTQEFAGAVSQEMLQPNQSEQVKILEQQLARAQINQRGAQATAELLTREDEAADREAALLEAQQNERLAQTTRQQLELLESQVDPCIPDFKGDTAVIGGLVGLIGAPNPLVLWEKLKVLAEIIPGIAEVITDAGDKFVGIGDATLEFIDNFSGENLSSLADQFNNFRDELNELGQSPIVSLEDIPQGNGCDNWLCGRLKDLLPFLDPDRPGSVMDLALDFSDEVTADFVATLQKVSALRGTAQKLMGEVAGFQSDLNSFKNKVFEFADNLAATGVFIHPIGRDGSLRNNSDFVDAVNQALFDAEDAGRPTFRGDSAVVAGFLIVIGAPNVEGLRGRFEAVSSAINGFSGKFEAINEAAGRVGEAASKLGDSLDTSEVDPAFQVGQTNQIQGGTESTLLAAGEALFEGESVLGAAEAQQQENQEAIATALAGEEAQQVTGSRPSVKLTQTRDPNTGLDTVNVEPILATTTINVTEGKPPTQTPLIDAEGEKEAPADSGAATQAIAALLRSSKRTSGGLG